MLKRRLYITGQIVFMLGSCLLSLKVAAQQALPMNTAQAQYADAVAQSAGEFDSVDQTYIHSLGMQQKAWNNPLAHMGEGQSKPGYS